VSSETVLTIGDESVEWETLEEPIELFPDMEGAHIAEGKRYPIFQVSMEEQGGLEGFCFKVIGRGATFCITKNCSVNHKGSRALMAVMPGDIFVAKKNATSAFMEPSIDGQLIHDSVMQAWKTKQLGLDDWSAKLVIVTSASDKQPTSSAMMDVHENFFQEKATAFKTPAKRKHLTIEEEPLFFKAAPYTPQFNNESKAFALQDLQEVINFLVHMDEGLVDSSITIHSLIDSYQLEPRKNGEDLNALWMRIKTPAWSLGTHPPTLGSEYEAPLVWAFFGQIATIIERILATLCAQDPVPLIDTARHQLENGSEYKITSLQEEFSKSIANFKKNFIVASRAVSNQVGDLEVLTAGLSTTNFGTTLVLSRPSSQEIKIGRQGFWFDHWS
jgi:hypothetical protein